MPSPDGKLLAVISDGPGKHGAGSTLRLFDIESGQRKAEYVLDEEQPHFSLMFAPDGKTLACSSSDRSLLFDCDTGTVLHRMSGRVGYMQFTPDGKTVAGSASSRMRLWDVASGKELNERPGNFDSTLATAISPDGRLLASAGWVERTVSVWDAISGKLLRQLPLGGEGRYVRGLAFSTDGKTLTAMQAMGFVQSWEVANGQEKHSVQIVIQNPERGSLFIYAWNLAADGKQMFSIERAANQAGSESTRLSAWDAATGAFIREVLLPGGSFADGWSPEAAWSPDVQMCTTNGPGKLSVVDLGTCAVRRQFPAASGGPSRISPDGRLVAAARPAANEQPGVTVWELLTGQEIATVATGPVRHVALAADNRSLITADDKFLKVWDLASSKERGRWPSPVLGPDAGRHGSITTVRLFPDGKRLFSALADGTALTWDVAPALAASSASRSTSSGESEIQTWWKQLAAESGSQAYASLWELVASGDSAVATLRAELKPAPHPEGAAMKRLIADLDNDSFDTRDKAFTALKQLGEAASPLLQEALTQNPPAEQRGRIEALLAAMSPRSLSADDRQRLRGVAVLELIGTSAAKELLTKLAAGAAHTPDTKEAKAALARLHAEGRR